MSNLLPLVARFAGTLLLVCVPCAAFAASGTLDINATVLSKSTCKFNNPKSQTIAFGTLDPSLLTAQVASTTFSFTCKGSATTAIYAISQDGGLYNAAGNRMRHATALTEFLPYSLSLTPDSGSAPKNVAQTMTVTVTIPPASFGQAIVGAFSDSVVLTISP